MKFRPTAQVCFGLFISAALVGVLGVKETPSEQGPARVDAHWPEGPVVEMLGINEAISYPERMEERNPLGSDPMESHLEEAAQTAEGIGARWTRGHTVAFPRLSYDRWLEEDGSWERFDTWLLHVQSTRMKAVGMIGPWPGNRTHQFTDSYTLSEAEQADYSAFVRAAVERYDGDGVSDMPGLTAPIRYWEIDNEPDLKNAPGLGRRARSGFSTPSQFARVIVLTAAAIREADPTAKILQGGIGRPAQIHGYEYMQALFSSPDVREAVDILSFHVYHRGPDVVNLESGIRRAQSVAKGKPVWLTEVSVPSVGKQMWISEEWQAEMVFRTAITALRLGTEKLFWHTLVDPPTRIAAAARSGSSSNSFFARQDDGSLREKLSAKAFSILAEVLEDVDWSTVHGVSVDGGRGVALGQKGWLIYGETDWVSVKGLQFSSAQNLFTGDSVELKPKSEGRIAVFTNEETVWLKP
jgi:hypothetical protein